MILKQGGATGKKQQGQMQKDDSARKLNLTSVCISFHISSFISA